RRPRRGRRTTPSGQADRVPPSALFFQAEDGIRGRNVTGVQTCALPIYRLPMKSPIFNKCFITIKSGNNNPCDKYIIYVCFICFRSEERRVGKECRYKGARAR